MDDEEQARATLRSAIRLALATTAHISQLSHGEVSEQIVDAVMTELTDPGVSWALKVLGNSADGQ